MIFGISRQCPNTKFFTKIFVIKIKKMIFVIHTSFTHLFFYKIFFNFIKKVNFIIKLKKLILYYRLKEEIILIIKWQPTKKSY